MTSLPARAGTNGAAGSQGTGANQELLGTFQFNVDIGGSTVASFSDCSGLEVQVKVDEVREGGQNEYVHRLPGRVEYGNLVLKRGYVLAGGALSNDFFNWCLSALNRQGRPVERRNVTVSLVSRDGRTRIFSWTFLDAYPVKWSGPSFRSGDNSAAIESLELAHRGLQVL